MMLRSILTCLSMLAGSAAIAQSSNLKALESDHEARGWEAVGRLDMKNGGFCSATLIAPNLVLSAAHCVFDRSNQLRLPEQMEFNAGLRNGKVAATRAIAKVAAHPGYNPSVPLTQSNVAHDLALLELETPIPTHEIDPFVLHGESVSPGPVSVVSYGQGRETLQSRQRECGLLLRDKNALVFDCNVTFGSSGAPVFSHLNGRGRILSVISGGTVLPTGERVSLGPHLPPLVDSLKKDLLAQATGPEATIKRISVGQSLEAQTETTTTIKRITVGQSRDTGAKFIRRDTN